MNASRNLVTRLQLIVAVATLVTIGKKMDYPLVLLTALMLLTFLFLTFYLISMDSKPLPVRAGKPAQRRRI